MVLRYITGGTNRKHQKSIQQQADALLRDTISVIDLNDHEYDHDELLQILQKYPSDVICSCHDHMGNTILHILFSRRACPSSESHRLDEKDTSVRKANRWTSRRRGRSLEENDSNKQRATLLQVVHYLTHCSDTTFNNNEANDENAIMGSGTHSDIVHNQSTCATSLMRQKSAGGSLPLHMACRFRYTSVQQQIDIIQYMIDTYPYAVQCPDMWGNLPIHEACDVNSSNIFPSIEIIILLIQIYPESIRIRNTDGNLPLHLITSTFKKSLFTMMNMDGLSESMRDDTTEDVVADNATKYSENVSSYELRQLEIVEYMVGYWPESIHTTNHKQQTALQLALIADTNVSMIEFLQWMSQKIDPPSSAEVPDIGTSDVDCKGDIVFTKGTLKATNPFDDDCETSNTTFNTTMNLSVLSDDVVPDVLFPSNIIDMDTTAKGYHDNDDESETDFDGVVELAEDYFEVVVVDFCTIDQNDNSANPNAQNNNEMLESLDRRGDLYFSNNIAWESYNNQYETVERFVSPF